MGFQDDEELARPAADKATPSSSSHPHHEQLVEMRRELDLTRAELSRALVKARAMLEVTKDGILVVDRSGRISDFSERAISLWDLPRDLLELDHGAFTEFTSHRVARATPPMKLVPSWPRSSNPPTTPSSARPSMEPSAVGTRAPGVSSVTRRTR